MNPKGTAALASALERRVADLIKSSEPAKATEGPAGEAPANTSSST